MRTAVRVAAGAAVAAVCLYFALRGAEWPGIRQVLHRTHFGWVTVMMPFGVIALYLRALRWRVLLRSLGRIGLRPAFSATAVGFMANVLLPLRAGELIRPVLLGRRASVPISAAFASVVLERLLDLLLLFCLLLALGIVVPVPVAMRRASYLILAALTAAVTIIMIVLWHRERAVASARRAFGRLPRNAGSVLGDVLDNFLAGAAGISDARTILVVLAYSLAVWCVIAVTYACALIALDIKVPLAAASVSLTVVVAAFVSLPQAPGYIGTWQAGCVAALGFYGVSREEAIGYSLVTHVVQVVVVVGLGAVCIVADKIGLRDLVALARSDRHERPVH